MDASTEGRDAHPADTAHAAGAAHPADDAHAVDDGRTRALFVNAGILGMQTFSKYIRESMALDPYIDARHVNLSERLSVSERLLRRAMCARLWPDGALGLRNLDFARLRQEYHAGFQAARRIRRIVARDRIDVLHFHRQTTAYASVGLMGRVPSIVSIDATQDAVIDTASSRVERWTYRPNAALDGAILRSAFAVVSTSRWAAECVRRRYPECDTPIHVMPPPVRMQFFDERWIEERYARATGGSRPRVLFIGGDFIRKGGEDLLAAWTSGELHRIAALDLVTDAPVDLSRAKGVRLIRDVESYTSEWSEVWRTADVFAMPTRSEAFGIVFSEASAAGLPIVATNVNAVPEQVVPGQTGLLVPPADRGALAEALRVLITSADLRRRFGRAARTRALEQFDPEEYRRRLRNLIRAASHTAPPRTPRATA